MSLGKRIKALRNTNDMTLKDLSEKIGISISFLSDIENERSSPSLERLQDIADGLGTTVSYLLGEEKREYTSHDIEDIIQSDLMQKDEENFLIYKKHDNNILVVRNLDNDIMNLFVSLKKLSHEEKQVFRVFLLGLLAKRKLDK
jgi:transcriptional regulator with XRE-family HTH domain